MWPELELELDPELDPEPDESPESPDPPSEVSVGTVKSELEVIDAVDSWLLVGTATLVTVPAAAVVAVAVLELSAAVADSQRDEAVSWAFSRSLRSQSPLRHETIELKRSGLAISA